MYRTDASDILEKIERLERELARAYDEQQQTESGVDGDLNLALLGHRARTLSRDIETLRRRKAGAAPRWRRAVQAITPCAVVIAFLTGAFTGASALFFAVSRTTPSRPEPPLPDLLAVELRRPAPAVEEAGQAADADTETAPDSRSLADGPDYKHEPLSPADYDKLMARSRAFFRAAEQHDGPALARLSHPTIGLYLSFEGVTLDPSALRTCFSSAKHYEFPMSPNNDDTRRETCGQIFDRYATFGHAPELTFNTVPEAATSLSMNEPEPYLFFFIPGREDRSHEFFWEGFALVFDRFGDDFVLATTRRAEHEL